MRFHGLGFPRQEYWSRLLFPPADLPNTGTELGSPAPQIDSLPLNHWGIFFLFTLHSFSHLFAVLQGFPGGLAVKNMPADAGDGRGNPLQYSCLENRMDRATRRATVHQVTELDTTEPLNTQDHFGFDYV